MYRSKNPADILNIVRFLPLSQESNKAISCKVCKIEHLKYILCNGPVASGDRSQVLTCTELKKNQGFNDLISRPSQDKIQLFH